MRKKFGPQSWLYPMPVLIIGTYNEDGTANAMNAAWGNICDYTKITLTLDKTHKTTANILARKAFTVSPATESQLIPSDYVGIVSGTDVPDKFSRSGFTAVKSDKVDAPIIEQLPMTLECRMISYDEDSEILIGEVVDISIDDSVLAEDGKVDVTKLAPISYDPVRAMYLKLGAVAGHAFRDGKQLQQD
ncbi:MAG: flavin reductase family protein [Selenomonadaceae bacterium]|nr:flavin reductase family protein [Selenomonadaceae bacterium]